VARRFLGERFRDGIRGGLSLARSGFASLPLLRDGAVVAGLTGGLHPYFSFPFCLFLQDFDSAISSNGVHYFEARVL